jgi:hypothetical protein
MTAIEQLLRDAMTTYTDDVPQLRPGTARTALRSSRRTSRVRLAAASTATVAATAGVGVFVVNLQPATTAAISAGGLASGANVSVSGAAPTPAAAGKSAPPNAVEVSGAAGPTGPIPLANDDTAEVAKTAAEAPADLVAVTIADQVAGLDLTRDHGGFYALTLSGKWHKYLHFSRPDAAADFTSGSIILTKGPETPHWNAGQSPSPSIGSLTVAGRAATNWVSGGDHYVSFTAGALTVQVFSSDKTVTTDQLVALGNALQGLPQ